MHIIDYAVTVHGSGFHCLPITLDYDENVLRGQNGKKIGLQQGYVDGEINNEMEGSEQLWIR